jgi:hypothetical protein
MKLFLKTSGGIGNIQLQGALDTDELPDALAERVRTVLTPAHLRASRSVDTAPVADAMQYELSLLLESGPQQFAIDDVSASPDVLEVVQELLQELIRRKRAAP